ncbi:MAG: outer membrane lipid asymmetry maintenance protein MlaD [Gammaproteobacteria bacterium]|nr:outer membrane lipid asymmetry maintenance protein MlaD [Pseudomonadales bacterium]MCP5348992.1 outer membrane lipid asymmetry maintenance protein MlaD [Pseudomonadales bacterium]
MKYSMLDLWVGLFIVVGVAAIVFLSLRVANQTTLRANETYSVTAEFDNIGGLKVRAPVRSAGVTVGRIADIYLDTTTFKAVVKLEIEEQFPFSSDTSASILTAGLLGEQYVSLQAGVDTETLSDGDDIWLTSSAMVLENLISNFMFNAASEGDQ